MKSIVEPILFKSIDIDIEGSKLSKRSLMCLNVFYTRKEQLYLYVQHISIYCGIGDGYGLERDSHEDNVQAARLSLSGSGVGSFIRAVKSVKRKMKKVLNYLRHRRTRRPSNITAKALNDSDRSRDQVPEWSLDKFFDSLDNFRNVNSVR